MIIERQEPLGAADKKMVATTDEALDRTVSKLTRNGWTPVDQLMIDKPAVAIELVRANVKCDPPNQDPVQAANAIDLRAAAIEPAKQIVADAAKMLDDLGEVEAAKIPNGGQMRQDIKTLSETVPATEQEADKLRQDASDLDDAVRAAVLKNCGDRICDLYERRHTDLRDDQSTQFERLWTAVKARWEDQTGLPTILRDMRRLAGQE